MFSQKRHGNCQMISKHPESQSQQRGFVSFLLLYFTFHSEEIWLNLVSTITLRTSVTNSIKPCQLNSYSANWTMSGLFKGKRSLFQMTAVRSHFFQPCYCCIFFSVAHVFLFCFGFFFATNSMCADNSTPVIRLDRMLLARLLT